jgi:hypothetical protein
LGKQRNKTDRSRNWYFVFAISRTWTTVDDKAVKDLVRHLPRRHSQRTWLPRLSTWQQRKTYWVYAKHLWLRDMVESVYCCKLKSREETAIAFR